MSSDRNRPLTADELERTFEGLLWSEISPKHEAAESLATLDRDEQDFVIGWVRTLQKGNLACAYQFTCHVHKAMAMLDLAGVEDWLMHAMDVYDRAGLYAALAVFRDVEGFKEQRRRAAVGVSLEEASGVLERFVLGLSGRSLKVVAAGEGEESYTDTECLYLPAITCRFDKKEDNFRLLKTTAVYLWAQTRFGTWRWGVVQALARMKDQPSGLALFAALETMRLEACVARELPGVYRQMRALNGLLGTETAPGWEQAQARLERPGAGVDDTLALLRDLLAASPPIPVPRCYQGRLYPERVVPVLSARVEDEKAGLRSLLVRLQEELAGDEPAPKLLETTGESPFSARRVEAETLPEGFDIELLFMDRPVAPPDDVRRVMGSIIQDLGEIPGEYLVPAGDGTYRPRGSVNEEEDLSASVWSGTYHEIGAHLYDEWDFRRQHYRKGWCVLRELDVHPQAGDFVGDTVRKYAYHLVSLRKTFEALRGEEKRLRREPFGDEVDIDALVVAHADARTGREMSDRLFTCKHKVERDIAVMFMVDMSGSTKGWINDAERESLVLLCESLESLGDRYAIYGFSGMSRKRCEVYRVKRFDESYDDAVRARIAGIAPKDYTRMGVAIRHLSRLLNQVEARTRVLITLSDGKPDDYHDEYRGEYGIEDTRRALVEAKRDGIHPFCITIDEKGQDYLPHMYGPVNYTIVDSVRKLPYKVSDIYRRITT